MTFTANIVLNWPQYVELALLALSVVFYCALHGKPMGTYNAGARIIDVALVLTLLYYGGFFAGAAP